MAKYNLTINGKPQGVEADPDMPLLYALRNDAGMKEPRFGCGLAQCGACTVLLNGEPVRSCVMRMDAVGDKKITTLAGLGTPRSEERRVGKECA